MKQPLALPEVVLITPPRFGDHRGYFMETYVAAKWFPEAPPFIQDNLSYSGQGVLRGLHLQNPGCQAKLVMALTGSIWDVAVDVRVGSPTFGKWVAEELSEENGRQLYVPRGFAHGFLVTSETARVCYKCDDAYQPANEVGLRWDDPELGIPWPIASPKLAAKDAAALTLREALAKGVLPRWSPA